LKQNIVTQPDNIALLDLMWKYYDRQRNFTAAARILAKLAEKQRYDRLQLLCKLAVWDPMRVPGLRIDPLRLLAGCRKRRLNQAPLNLRGLI